MHRIRLLAAAGVTILALGGGAGLAAPAFAKADKVYVCHHTSSETNPWVLIHISRNALDKHLENHGGTGPDAWSETPDIDCANSGGGED